MLLWLVLGEVDHSKKAVILVHFIQNSIVYQSQTSGQYYRRHKYERGSAAEKGSCPLKGANLDVKQFNVCHMISGVAIS
jgi:hypothetical protein